MIATRTSRVVAITGAGSGIGRATALAFLDAGHRVALIGRRAAALEETLSLSVASDAGRVFCADVRNAGEVEQVFKEIVRYFNRIDVLFNNAGHFPQARQIEDVSVEDWCAVIDVNLTGAFLCAREAFRHMKAQVPGGGRIINNGSISAHSPRPLTVAYTASKHAVTGLTKSLSLEGREWNIACGQIDIGNAETDLTAGFGSALQPDGSIMREPMMNGSDVARAVLMMADLPLDTNVQYMTIMATAMPFIGRG